MAEMLDRAVKAAAVELARQYEEGKPGPYVVADDPSDVLIDGRIDLVAVVRAIRVAVLDEANAAIFRAFQAEPYYGAQAQLAIIALKDAPL
jgi:hypothetical protein